MKPESTVQQEIMIEAAKHGIILWRNNVGAGMLRNEDGGQESYVRFGLANESKARNKTFKSSDLIGVWPYSIQGVGLAGLFIAIEVKKEGWTYTGTPREKAQLAFIDFVKSKGGVAGFCQSTVDFLRLIGKA